MFKGCALSLTGMAQDLFEGEKVLAFDLGLLTADLNQSRKPMVRATGHAV